MELNPQVWSSLYCMLVLFAVAGTYLFTSTED